MSNMVSLIAPVNRDAPSMFKWPNGFSWAYTGNITDSMKQRVKALGGNVSGVLRFSIQWNDNGDNEDDLDAHAMEPGGNHIYFGNKARAHRSSGILDVDIIYPSKQAPGGVAVENIVWTNQNNMPEGVYQLFVNCYSHRGGRSGFSAEVEFDGQIHRFNYPNPLRTDENVPVADVVYNRRDGFKLIEKLPYTGSSVKIWGLCVNQFHPVSVIMYSPNYWDEQTENGNRHYFFMLKGCRNPENPNGFYNEFLKNELLEHKHVFEALGNKMRVQDSEEQLSGIGFSSTHRNFVVVRVKGNVDRTIKIVI